MITVGGFLANCDPAGLAAEDADELVVDDLDDLLGGVEGAADLGTERPLAHRGGELPHHRQRDVGVEQGDPDVADRRVDVGLGQAALAPEALEGDGQAVREAGEHGPQANRRRLVRVFSRDSTPSHASISMDTACATRAGGRLPTAELGDVERVERLPRVGGDVGAADASPARAKVMPISCSSPTRSTARTSITVASSEACGTTMARVWPGEPEAASALAVRLAPGGAPGTAAASGRRRRGGAAPRASAAASGASPPGDSTCHWSAAMPS